MLISGYQACRMLAACTDVAAAIGQGVRDNSHPDAIASKAYLAMWNKQNRGQRLFQVMFLL